LHPKKYLWQITTEAKQSENSHIVATKDIEDVLNQLIALPDNGKMHFVKVLKFLHGTMLNGLLVHPPQ